jgi:hypothetical protein
MDSKVLARWTALADGPWRTASGGRPWRTAPGGGVRQAVRPAVRQPADGRSGRLVVGWPSAMPSAGWGGGRHAVRRSDGRPPCRPPGRVADGMPSGGRPWGCRTRPDVLRTLTWTSGRMTTLHTRSDEEERGATTHPRCARTHR